MSDLLARLDAAIDGRCPCGASPAPGSAYCGDDCTPTHRSVDTTSETDGTQMRWRPDLVTEADDSSLTEIPTAPGIGLAYDGHNRGTLYSRTPDTWHLRLDDGHRYVGMDVSINRATDPAGATILDEGTADRIRTGWQRLERELGNSQHLEPDADPWADAWLPSPRVQQVVCDWLRENNINPHDVPTWASIHVTRDSITLPVMVRGIDDRILISPVDPMRVHTEEKVFPLLSGSVPRELLRSGLVHVDNDGNFNADFRSVMQLDNEAAAFTPTPATAWSSESSDPIADIRRFTQRSFEASFQLSPEAIRSMRESFERASEAMRRAVSTLSTDCAPEPEHPMLAAIEARRNRNTGPGQQQRAPRQINPRRGR